MSRRRSPRTRAGRGLVAALALVVCHGCARTPPQPPDILLITADTLRADRLGCYGYPRDTSPHIDRFAEDAVLFANCLSHAADTRFSFASILSGFLPHETGILDRAALPAQVRTLPEMLRSAGYSTAAVVSNYVLRREQGYEQGFAVYDDTMDERELVRSWPERIAEKTTDAAIRVLERAGDAPLFLWVLYQDPHGPYAPPAEFVRESPADGKARPPLRVNSTLSGDGGIPAYQTLGGRREFHYYADRYDGEVRYLDHHLGRLLEALRRLDRYHDAVIVFTSDHGEGLGEHDYYFAHGEHLYQHQTHVPLIVRLPDGRAGRRDDYVQHVDLVPTLLALAGLAVDSPFRGTDLFDPAAPVREILAETRSPFARHGRKLSLVRDGFKLIFTPPRGLELYDLRADPGEATDLIARDEQRGRVQELGARLRRIRGEDRLALGDVPLPRPPTPEELEKLRSLGYVQ